MADMKTGLSYVLVTPYTIAKSRTGGVLSRLLSRTDLDLVGAQMFAADGAFAAAYAGALRGRSPGDQFALLADYVGKNLAPAGGQSRRCLLLLFKGENPCEKLMGVCGQVNTGPMDVGAISGETIRETFADLVLDADDPGVIRHFEPAVLTARCQRDADEDLRMMADFLEGRENVVDGLAYADGARVERTLVILKPDNWTYNSSRPGAIVDMFSRTGLRIVGVKVHRFSLAQAMEFYGPVEGAMRKKLAGEFGRRAKGLLEREFGVALGRGTLDAITESFGVDCAADEFARLVEFMSGRRPGCPRDDVWKPGDVKCMILVYEGEDAVAKIRGALGPTDPAAAPGGTVRREFGSTVMINTAHASDSVESFERERGVVGMDGNTLVQTIRESAAADN